MKARKADVRKLLSLLLLASVTFLFLWETPALAGEHHQGAKIFTANCAACHIGGGNIIHAHKSLNKHVLEKYHMDSIEAIAQQIKHGKKAMPAFKGRLDDRQIEEVAAYVLEQAARGWHTWHMW